MTNTPQPHWWEACAYDLDGSTVVDLDGSTDLVPNLDLRYWVEMVSTRLPDADPSTVATLALHLVRASVAPYDLDGDNGSFANAVADLTDAEGLTRWARLADMTPGSIDALRALHSWTDLDHETEGAPDHPIAPDPYDGQKHEVTRKRSRSGRTSTTVRRRGVAQVQGSWRPWWAPVVPRTCDASHLVIVRWWERHQAMRHDLRRGRYGSNAISVQRAERARFRGDVPALMGTDLVAYAEVIEAGAGAVDIYGVTVRHDDLGGFASRWTNALSDAMRGRYRSVDDLDGSIRLDEDTATWSRPTSTGLDWEPTYRLPAVRARKSEPTTSVELLAPGIGRTLVPVVDHEGAQIIGPYGAHLRPVETARVFIGHRGQPRGPVARKRTRKSGRTIGTVRVRTPDDVTTTLAGVAPGKRVILNGGPWHATVTRSVKGRWSSRLTDAAGTVHALDGARTARRVAAFIASHQG